MKNCVICSSPILNSSKICCSAVCSKTRRKMKQREAYIARHTYKAKKERLTTSIKKGLRPEYSLLSKTYTNQKSELDWYCIGCKRFFRASLNQHFSSTYGGCEECFKNSQKTQIKSLQKRQFDLNSIKVEIAKTGRFEFVDSIYRGLVHKHKLKCTAKGHTVYQRLDTLLYRGYGCGACFKEEKEKDTITSFNHKLFCLERGFKVEGNYKSEDSVLEFECNKGHKHSKRFASFKNRPNCPICKRVEVTWVINSEKRLLDAGMEYLHRKGCTVFVKCSCEKLLSLTPNQIVSNKICCNYLPKSNLLELYGYTKLSETPTKRGKYPHLNMYTFKCTRGHIFDSSFRYLSEGHGCKMCATSFMTQPEARLLKFLTSLGYETSIRDYTILKTQELDVYVPSLQLGIEYVGIWWHSIEHCKRNDIATYFQNKVLECYKQNTRLITILESEFIKDEDEVLNKLKRIIDGEEIEFFDLRWAKYNGQSVEPPKLHYFDRKCIEVRKEEAAYSVYDCGRIIT